MTSRRTIMLRLLAGRLRLDLIEEGLGRLSSKLILSLALISLTAMFAIFGCTLYVSRLDAAAAARTASSNLVRAVGLQLAREIETLDLSLQDLVEGAGSAEVTALPRALRRAVLFDRAATARGHGALLLLDDEGRLVEQAGDTSALPIDFSRESFFKVHVAARDVGLYIGHPFVSLVDGETSVALSRRVERGGLFVGVAVATIRLSSIQEMFRTLDLGRNGTATLLADDGTILVRQPFVAAAVGSDKIAPIVRSRMGRVSSGDDAFVSPIDGVRRLLFSGPVGTSAMTVVIAQSVWDVYAGWWLRASLTGAVMLVLGNVILVLIAALQVALRRRKVAEAALEKLARTDKLTGLANRRSFDEAIDVEWERAKRSGQPLALVLLDIDHFKAFNDIFGHQGGDDVLAAVGLCISRATRHAPDLAVRYGGEEFAVLLPNATEQQALGVAQRIERLIGDLRQPHPASSTSFLTVSAGVAVVLPRAGGVSADLVRFADVSLYEAKRAGRNRIILRDARGARTAA